MNLPGGEKQQVSRLDILCLSPRVEGDSAFEARDRDFPASLVVRDVFSGEITRRMISSDSVFTKTVFLACADSDPCGRISIMSPGFACGMATMIISLEWFSLKHPVESVF